MKARQKVISVILTLILTLSMTLGMTVVPAQAASKKTVYVISSIKNTGTSKSGTEETYTQTFSYNKNGLIKKIKTPNFEKVTETFTYSKKYPLRLTKYVEKIGAGDFKGTSSTTYSYDKKGQRIKAAGNYPGGGTFTYVYTWKNGKIVSMKEGDMVSKFTYKKGHVTRIFMENKKEGFTSETIITLDKKGNAKKMILKNNGVINKDAYGNAKFTYNKKGRVTKIVEESKNPMMKKAEKLTRKITYKKIKVDKKYVKAIKAQQWTLLNSMGGQQADSL